ncbi:hypothetical protein [Polyangium aurulentum]|uniref:hypothetical protein n=1 Tax=Polyangium aurulentum TaxID=2567896 RepID=UPI00146A5A66|nr:hypothetical protein [Polyangium aurulentum]UQA59915.1 hypothetical protein E8A73_005330 [Polyangium aurulentum]
MVRMLQGELAARPAPAEFSHRRRFAIALGCDLAGGDQLDGAEHLVEGLALPDRGALEQLGDDVGVGGGPQLLRNFRG